MDDEQWLRHQPEETREELAWLDHESPAVRAKIIRKVRLEDPLEALKRPSGWVLPALFGGAGLLMSGPSGALAGFFLGVVGILGWIAREYRLVRR